MLFWFRLSVVKVSNLQLATYKCDMIKACRLRLNGTPHSSNQDLFLIKQSIYLEIVTGNKASMFNISLPICKLLCKLYMLIIDESSRCVSSESSFLFGGGGGGVGRCLHLFLGRCLQICICSMEPNRQERHIGQN